MEVAVQNDAARLCSGCNVSKHTFLDESQESLLLLLVFLYLTSCGRWFAVIRSPMQPARFALRVTKSVGGCKPF